MGTGEHSEIAQAKSAFALHFVQQAEEAVRQLDGPDYKQAEAFLRREGENCREALLVLFDSDKPVGLRLLVAVGEIASTLQLNLEQWLEWMERYHEACAGMPPSAFTARLALQLGWARWFKNASSEMPWEIGQCWEEAVRLAHTCGDLATLAEAQVGRSMAGDDLPAEARAALTRDSISNARASGDKSTLAAVLVIASIGPLSGKNFPSRKKEMEEALAIEERLGGRQPCFAVAVDGMGRLYRAENMHAEAEPWFVRAHEMARSLKRPLLHFAFDLPLHYLFSGQPGKARPVLKETFADAISFDAPKFLCDGLVSYVLLASAEGKFDRAGKLYAAWMAQVSPGKEPPAEHLAMMNEDDRRAVREEWAAGQAMSLDEAVAFAKGDW